MASLGKIKSRLLAARFGEEKGILVFEERASEISAAALLLLHAWFSLIGQEGVTMEASV